MLDPSRRCFDQRSFSLWRTRTRSTQCRGRRQHFINVTHGRVTEKFGVTCGRQLRSLFVAVRLCPPLEERDRALDAARGTGDRRCPSRWRDVVWSVVGFPSMASRCCASVHWHIGGCQEELRSRACEGGRCRPGSLAVRTPWVALSVVSSVDPTSSTSRAGNARKDHGRMYRSRRC